MIILYNIAHRSGRLPGSLYFFRVKWPEFSTDLHEVVEGFLTQMSDSPGSYVFLQNATLVCTTFILDKMENNRLTILRPLYVLFEEVADSDSSVMM
jgi:hypothetical protein